MSKVENHRTIAAKAIERLKLVREDLWYLVNQDDDDQDDESDEGARALSDCLAIDMLMKFFELAAKCDLDNPHATTGALTLMCGFFRDLADRKENASNETD